MGMSVDEPVDPERRPVPDTAGSARRALVDDARSRHRDRPRIAHHLPPGIT